MSKLNLETIQKMKERGYNLRFENPEYLNITKNEKTILEVIFDKKEGVSADNKSGVILTKQSVTYFKRIEDIYIEEESLKIAYFKRLSGEKSSIAIYY